MISSVCLLSVLFSLRSPTDIPHLTLDLSLIPHTSQRSHEQPSPSSVFDSRPWIMLNFAGTSLSLGVNEVTSELVKFNELLMIVKRERFENNAPNKYTIYTHPARVYSARQLPMCNHKHSYRKRIPSRWVPWLNDLFGDGFLRI